MALSSEPVMDNFKYCLIPTDNAREVEEMVFKGTTDKELRDGIAKYFAKAGFTDGQKEEFQEKMTEQITENAKKHSTGAADDNTKPDPVADKKITDDVLKQAVMTQNAAEIVPVIYPDSSNDFKGVSLYIDQVGRFKDLPLNERASKMSQRDIRGDAFVISSYDDPIKDTWARVSCDKTAVLSYIETPPNKAMDPTAKAAAMGASETKEVTLENLCKAKSLKESGNTAFKKPDYELASQSYTEALTELTGRADESLPIQELTDLTSTLMLNRAQAKIKLNDPKAAVADCSAVVSVMPSVKALYRRATAQRMLHNYDEALKDLFSAKELQPTDASVLKLIGQVEAEKAKESQAEKAVYKKMFA